MENFNAKLDRILETIDEFCEDYPYLVGYVISVLGLVISVNYAYSNGYQRGKLAVLSKAYELMIEQKR